MNAGAIDALAAAGAEGRSLPVSLDLEAALQHEMRLLGEVAAGRRDFGLFIWSCQRCLVVPRSIAGRPAFAAAEAALRSAGWPLHARTTGGDVTPQGPGIVNVSIVFVIPPERCNRVHAAYSMLCEPLLESLRQQGIEACLAPLAGAMCDGRYNVVCHGKKLAGTAQRWRPVAAVVPASGSFAVLAHASIYCDSDLVAAADAVQRFLTLCGAGGQIERDRHLNLSQLLGSGSLGACRTFHKDLERRYLRALAHRV